MSKTILSIIKTDKYRCSIGDINPPDYPAIGIEIEVEKAGVVREDLKYWNIITDGSLRDSGREFVLRKPVALKDRLLPILEYNRVTAGRDNQWVHNYRTSVHVHINVAPLTLEEFNRLIKLYMLVEGTMYRAGGVWRRDSPYCIPANDSPRMFNMLCNAITDVDSYIKACKTFRNPSFKYCGLGLFRLGDLCTVEFRMHEGTNDTERLEALVDMCADLYDLASSEHDIAELASAFSEAYDTDPCAAAAEQERVALWWELASEDGPRLVPKALHKQFLDDIVEHEHPGNPFDEPPAVQGPDGVVQAIDGLGAGGMWLNDPVAVVRNNQE